MIPILLICLLLALAVAGYCVVRASSRADQIAAEIDRKLFVDPEVLAHVALPHGREIERPPDAYERCGTFSAAIPSSEGSGVGQSQIENPKSKILVVLLEIEVGPSTRFPGIPAEHFENQLRMECARGARLVLDGSTLGEEPRVSVELLPVPSSGLRDQSSASSPLTTDH